MLKLIAVAAFSLAAVQDDDYFPLRKGNEWTYSMSNGQTLTVKVSGLEKVSGVECAVIESSSGGQKQKEWIAVTAEGVKSYKIESGGQTLEYKKPLVYVKLPFNKGDTWMDSVEVGNETTLIECKSEDIETLKVGENSYECIKVSRKFANALGPVTTVAWFGKGVGQVKFTWTQGGQTATIELAKSTIKPVDKTGEAPKTGAKKCAKCGTELKSGAKFCSECGAKIEEEKKDDTHCPKCKAEIKPGAKFCPECGAKIEKSDKAPSGEEMESFESKDGKVLLYHPKGWKAEDLGAQFGEGTYSVSVQTKDESAGVLFMTFALSDQIKDSVDLAKVLLGNLGKSFKDVRVPEMTSTQDRMRTSAEVALTEQDGAKYKGRFYFFRSERAGTLYALMAKEDKWEEMRPKLATIVANLAYAPQGVRNALKEARESAEKTKRGTTGEVGTPNAMVKDARNRDGKKVSFQHVVASDGSFEMDIPQGWSFEGQALNGNAFGDAKRRIGATGGSVSVVSPQSPMAGMQGVVTAPYQPPAQALEMVFKILKIGSGFTVLSESRVEYTPEELQQVQLLRAQGTQLDTRYMYLEFTHADTGEKCRAIYTITCMAAPMGYGWSVIGQGYYAPANEFDDWLPVFVKMQDSTKQNQQWVQGKLSAQAAESARLNRNLQKSLGELRESYDRYNQSYWERSRSQDYISWMRSQTTLGQGSWVSEREGAAVIHTDSWGLTHREHGDLTGQAWNTTNFNGRNPWTGEQLHEINTRVEYEKYIRK